MLRAKTLECATLMGVAVGKEMFANDAIEIMNVLKTMEDAGMKSDDPQIAYTLTRYRGRRPSSIAGVALPCHCWGGLALPLRV